MDWKPACHSWLLLLACSPSVSAAEPDSKQAINFETKIRPILVEKCLSCHGANEKKIKGNLRLDSREALLRGGDLGPAIVPGKSADSRLIKAIEYADSNLSMPPSGKLPANEITLLRSWIDSGAVWPANQKSKSEQASSNAEDANQKHWAWQPLLKTPLPKVNDQTWASNDIDRYVLHQLETRKLRPVAAADRETLIRRAYLDLWGLPAPPAEVKSFINDTNPEAYEKLIDRLLASPHYGERWGRYWLDVARHSDGLGGFLDGAGLPDAWRYRDWVVKSLNDDLPYDQFVIRQIAGDLLGDPSAAIGTGFLAVGPTYNDDGGDPDSIAKTRAETLDDRVDTVTRAFLGLTIACARCHDHKFDPIPQADYYSIAAVFNNTRIVHQRADTPENLKRFAEHRKQVQNLEARLNAISKQGLDAVTRAFQKSILAVDLKQLREATPPAGPMYHGVIDSGSADMAIAIRGDLRRAGPIVPRRFPAILTKGPRPTWTVGSGRLPLAKAIASAENPLVARVIVNRLWQGHFGKPLVRTPENFGILGEKPTHPELLDWLAARLISSDWSLKAMHKTIMLSATYRLSSRHDETNFLADGDNRLIWRMNPRRLDVEAWRDSLMSVTGELDMTIGGPPVPDILASRRRTLYASVSRNGDRFASDTFLRLFDFPSARATISERPTSTVPQQFLFLLNSPFMEQRAKAFVARLQAESKEDSDRIRQAYWLLYSRSPSAEESRLGLDFLGVVDAGRDLRWRQYAQVLLGSHEFMQLR